tara:strand:- start:1488 stop:2345 length:858 start_codon:yes stop_codon:yes gene_type:complete
MLKKISKKQINFFKKKGYLIIKSFFNKKKISLANKWLKSKNSKAITKSWTETEPGVPIAVYSVLNESLSPVYSLSANKIMLKLASQLMKEDVYIWHSKVNFKDRWCGTAEYYHQDQVYWKDRGYKSDKMLSCMIALEPHNQSNAGLKLFSGSHKLGFIRHEPFININGLCKFMINQKKLDFLYKKHELVDIHVEPGDILFFHSSIVHGSSHNASPNSRSIILSQLNTFSNLPKSVQNNAVKFNLKRSKIEYLEAKRRLKWFENKFLKQKKTKKITFSAPIPFEEK